MESYENLRRSMISILENREAIPENIKKIIIKMFEKVEESYKELGCHNSTIETYMQGNLMETLQGRIGNVRKDGQTKEANFRESLDVGISLEEQKENVLQFQKSEETKREDDKNLHSQSLPELFK